MSLPVYFLAVYAIVFAARAGKMSWVTTPLCKIEFFQQMFQCVYCTATEVGWLLAAIMLVRPARFAEWWELVLEIFVLGLAAGAFSMLLESFLELQDGILTYIFKQDGTEAYQGPEAVGSPEEGEE